MELEQSKSTSEVGKSAENSSADNMGGVNNLSELYGKEMNIICENFVLIESGKRNYSLRSFKINIISVLVSNSSTIFESNQQRESIDQ